MGKALTLTVISNMTSNYGEGLGNISSIQKVFKNGKIYAIRSRESLKNALMVTSGLYDDVETTIDKSVTQKLATAEKNVSNCRALEAGYMTTGKSSTYIRKSSFYLTDAIAAESFINESRFHNNLYLANKRASANNLNLQLSDDDAGDSRVGLMPYQYEYDKSLKIYSLTIDLDMIGKEYNFGGPEADNVEKVYRVKALLKAVEELSLVVKGNLDNAEPVFVIGGISERKTHVFENVVRIKNDSLDITEDLKDKLNKGFSCGLCKADILNNDRAIEEQLKAKSVHKFFEDLKAEVDSYYGV
ncbi:MAG: type I-B CRISPR-associated protein Cas7/Cst2/DevR [Clostridiales bacterium]|nr:type I-B CRISPR-associated protein Cas7/Cst2/DevR [Clostridiales bacterium]